MMPALAALIWIFLCSAAGATPRPWHRGIAYVLMIASLPIMWGLYGAFGLAYALLFLMIGIFQLRLLLIHWLKRAVRRYREVRQNKRTS